MQREPRIARHPSYEAIPLRRQQFQHPLVEPLMRLVLHPMPDAGHKFERRVAAELIQPRTTLVEMRSGGRVMLAPDPRDTAGETWQAARERAGVRNVFAAHA